MKKALLLGLAIIFIAAPVFAQSRGALTNVYASWYTVTSAQTTISLPIASRDVYIKNGDATAADAVCVDFTGGALDDSCVTNTSILGGMPSQIQIPGGTDIHMLSDYVTSAISLRALDGDASPVTVIITY